MVAEPVVVEPTAVQLLDPQQESPATAASPEGAEVGPLLVPPSVLLTSVTGFVALVSFPLATHRADEHEIFERVGVEVGMLS